MVSTSFGVCLVISILILLWMSSKEYENIDMYFWTIVIIIPVIILGYWLKTQVQSPEGALIAFCFIYFDSTVLLTVGLFLMLRSIDVVIKPWIKVGVYTMAFIHLFAVWTSVYNGMYFSSVKLINVGGDTATKMTGGPLRIFHFIYIGLILCAMVATIIAGYFKKGTFSRKSFHAYVVIAIICIVVYGIEGFVDVDFSVLPYIYVVGDLIVAIKYDRIHAHDISCIISDYQKDDEVMPAEFNWMTSSEAREARLQKESIQRGYVAFDLKRNFLSCNDQIQQFWPEFATQRVDEPLPMEGQQREVFYSMIDAFEKRGERTRKYRVKDKTVACEISTFSISKHGRDMGYFFEVRDASGEQQLIDEITENNTSLEEMIAAKTADIRDIQGKIVTGMANMIENRDNNTGGHVKRTSDIIRIIIDEIVNQKLLDIDESFANDIVRAAPTHDLGKLTIENSILNKPAKLSDEEYEIMKGHASKSGEMVMILLDGVEEEHFVQVAYKVARYHHERWDGKGYPEHLVGSMIPIEARIMAVADVYDALASKRSYKDAMDPDLVAKIMIEGMGTQFDPAMKPVFIGCREKLEAYYRKENAR